MCQDLKISVGVSALAFFCKFQGIPCILVFLVFFLSVVLSDLLAQFVLFQVLIMMQNPTLVFLHVSFYFPLLACRSGTFLCLQD